jgi:hypothetical protein
VGDRGRGQGDRGGPGHEVRRLDLQRARARSDPPGPRRRASADQLHQRLGASPHDPLPRDPPGRHGRDRRGFRGRLGPDRRELHLRVRCRSVRPAPLRLPHESAGRPHSQGSLRRFPHRPEEGPPRRRRARDGHERVRHQLRREQRGLRRQHRRVPLPGQPDQGQAGRAGAELPGEPARV